MSSDETFVCVVALVVSLVVWGRWGWACAPSGAFGGTLAGAGTWLWITPVVCAGILLLVLLTAAAEDVRYDPTYVFFYLVLGAAWLGAYKSILALAGLSARDDVLERGNEAAAVAISGALVGLTLCFAGGNVGDGPGWWVVVFSGLMATGAFYLIWCVAARLTGWADRITIDRDVSAGIRCGGYFVGTGLILGRAVAGDWESAVAAALDFLKLGWPALLLAGAAVVLEKRLRPEAGRSLRGAGLRGWLPAILYVAIAFGVVALMGPWS